MLIFPSQVPSAVGPSTGIDVDGQPEVALNPECTNFAPHQRDSQAYSSEDMVQLLRTQLEEIGRASCRERVCLYV